MAGSDASFEGLLELLKEERGFDFTGYKRASLVRRVQRRMEAVGVDDFDQLHHRLMAHPEEITALLDTILITVTRFFRDEDDWSFLQHTLLPELLSRRHGQPIRGWCAGCASGEEAYTLAMVLAESMGVEELASRVKIYATDVDEEALAVGRRAAYTDRDVSGVPDELRSKYFERQGSLHRVSEALRRSVVFGRNDLVQDAPISHVDVLVCRNTLMYFDAGTQADVVQRLHFALRPDGVLSLGKAEMLLDHTALFRPVQVRRRFFSKVSDGGQRRSAARPAPDPADSGPAPSS